MRKILAIILLVLLYCNTSFANDYYFKECTLSNAVMADYIINLDKNVIEVSLKAVDGTVQNFSDKIKSVQEKKIISEKIKSSQGENIYYQYFLNADSNTIIKLQYIKQSGEDMDMYKLNLKRTSRCTNVKVDWNKANIEKAKISKEQKQILKTQEKIKKEQKELIKCIGSDHKQWNKCKGTFVGETGHKYNGEFRNGQIIKGISIYPGGSKYMGDFKNFMPDGYGTFIWKNGDKYFGEWKIGKTNGNGTKTWKDGRKYMGTFKNDKLHGKGTLFYTDGNKYEGEFINGKRHGEGIFTYSDGSAYIGKFVAGKEQGVGECVAADGKSVECESKGDTQTKDFSGKDTRDIAIASKKWVRISQYENNSKKGKKIMDKLKLDFESTAYKLCSPKTKFNVLEKKIEVLEVDETPAYGLETVLKVGINGVVECI